MRKQIRATLLTVAHLQCEEPGKALARLADALRLDNGYFNGWLLKARIEAKMEMPAEAAQTVRRALSSNPQMPAEQAQELRAFAQERCLRI